MVNAGTNFSMGTQTVAAQCFIREHTHAHNDEVIHMLEGKGIARLDGVEYPIEKGSTVFIGRNRKHHFINRSDEPFTFLWLMMPGGLDDFLNKSAGPATSVNRIRILSRGLTMSRKSKRARFLAGLMPLIINPRTEQTRDR